MKILKYLTIVIVAVSLFTGCTKKFEEYNDNIDSPPTISSDLQIGYIVSGMANTLYSTFNGCETGMSWVQHEGMIQYNDPERYKPRVTTIDGMWNNFYIYASNANSMYKLATTEGNKLNQGVALVLKAYSFSVLTDVYGSIPYTEALLLEEGITKPKFDSQQVVYAGILSTLDEAVVLLNSGQGSIDSTFDVLFHGDSSKWIRFANSLKFRSLMRISAKQAPGTQLQALVDGGKLINSNDNEAKLQYLANSPNANPLYETIVEGGRAEHKLNKTFVDYLVDTNDPRLESYAQEAENGGYVGKPSGYAATPVTGFDYKDVSSFGTRYLEATAPGYFISYSEMLFLMAEAAKKGYISGGDTAAKTYYEAGILNSFVDNGVPSTSLAPYLTQAAIAYNPTNALRQISEQKWIVLFSQGFEAWAEWRRMPYPALTPAIDGFINQIPSRYQYPSNEALLNAANYQSAIASQGQDAFTTKVWWMP